MLIAGISILILGGLLFIPGMYLMNEGDRTGIVLFISAALAFALAGFLIGEANTSVDYCKCCGQALPN